MTPEIVAIIMQPNFAEVLDYCAADPVLVREFDRLWGFDLSRRGTPIDLAVDDATGRTKDGCKEFILFVNECVYSRIVERAVGVAERP